MSEQRGGSQPVLIAVVAVVAIVAVAVTVSVARATSSGQSGRLAFGVVDTTAEQPNVDIYSVLPNGKGLKRLTTSAAFDACPAYSRDGRTIAFCSDRDGDFDIYLMSHNGKRERRITTLGGATFPDISPSGDLITFSRLIFADGADPEEDEPAAALIYIVPTQGGTPTALTSTGFAEYPVFSPDGSKIAYLCAETFEQWESSMQVCVMDADGTDPAVITSDATAKDQVPEWSPDGSQIAYAADGDIWVMAADGAGQRRITATEADEFGVAWSPDGDEIAFLRVLGEDERWVHVMAADGSDVRVLFEQPGHRHLVPAWQPRGR